MSREVTDLPAYHESTLDSLNLTITNHFTKQDKILRRRIAVTSEDDFDRTYVAKYTSASAFKILPDRENGTTVSYVKKQNAGLFLLQFPYADPSAFEMPNVSLKSYKFTNFDSVFKVMPPILLDMRSRNGIDRLTWRIAVMSSGVKLVLVDEAFQEYAHFVNELSAKSDISAQVWGRLSIGKGANDTLLVEQIILSLLAIYEVHIQLAADSGGAWKLLQQMVTGVAPPCVVM